MQEAKLYKKSINNAVLCELCHHLCKIKEGDTGLCKTRLNEKGKLITLVYGFPAALDTEAIEKKSLYHFFPGTLTYSIGTLGCNLTCQNCQVWDLSQIESWPKQSKNLNYISPKRVVEEALFNGCDSIAYSYTEPTIFFEYALDIMKIAQKEGLKNVWTSNGFMTSRCLDDIIPFLDAACIDLKSMDDRFYKNYCSGKLQPILDNLIKLKQEQVHLEISSLIVPEHSDDINIFSEIAEFISDELDSDTPWHIARFIPDTSWKTKHLPKTAEDLIYEAYELAKDAGLKYVYTSNIPGDQKENTYCPKCGELAIRRLGQHLERLDANGHCTFCDRSLDIIE
jgi:pyruvate formate lyase activating enzyme